MLDRIHYTTILSQVFSPCGNYLVAGNSYGQIAVYNLNRVLNPDEKGRKYSDNAEYVFDVEKDIPIGALTSLDKYLVVGSCGEISAWDWKAVIESKMSKPAWKIAIPNDKRTIDRPDVNSMWWNETFERLFVGCGDNNIYCFDVSNGKLVNTYVDHTDYIHSVHGINVDMVSASEDGQIELWDIRTPKSHSKFAPHTNDKLARPDLGKWVGCATLSDDWIICGGGPRLGLLQRKSLHMTAAFDLPDRGIHVCHFFDDRIIAGGTSRHLFQLNYSGEVVAEIPVSATTVYSAIEQTTPQFIFSIAGSSPYIDICTNLNYKDQSLYFKQST